MDEINYEELSDVIIEDGFFSEYLPSAFGISLTTDVCSIEISTQPDLIEPLSFTMSRFSEGGKRRTIFVPEFASYLATARFMKEKGLFQDLIAISADPHSYSPILQSDGKLTRHEWAYNIVLQTDAADQEGVRSRYIPNVIDKINRARGAKGILSLDISNFFHSIYTHLIPSIKLGYEEAEKMYKLQKANNADPQITDEYRTYVILDQHIRNMNAARTNGLLPGTLISQFIAEALLSRIDKEIEKTGIQFVRYVDDYEIFIFDETEIERTQNLVASILSRYFFSLNNEKIKYTTFPYYVVENLEKIYQNYKKEKPNEEELMKLFNQFFALEHNGTKGAIRFLIKSIDESFYVPDTSLFSSYLFNVLVNDSRSLIKVCQLMIHRKSEIKFGESELSLIEELLIKHIEKNNHLEAIWLLYLRKKVSRKRISAKISHMIAKSNNDLAKIILLAEYHKFLSNTHIQEIINSSNSWLLFYQLFFMDYIDKHKFAELSKIRKNLAFYSTLKRNHFSFYQ